MRDLNVVLVQESLDWHDPEANRERLSARLAQLDKPADLIVLPEMFTTGFTMDPAAPVEPDAGPTHDWLRAEAASTGAVVTGSVRHAAADGLRNRMLWARPDGSITHYDKRHRFRMADEHLAYQAGDQRVVVELAGWRICLQICYDLRFPVWSRNRGDYDLLLYVANWPGARREHWRTLLRARAIENLSYVVGVNRVGIDGNGIEYAGESAALDPDGQALTEAGSDAGVFYCRLDAQKLTAHRDRFPAHHDADSFVLGSE